jgi:thymidylate synthase
MKNTLDKKYTKLLENILYEGVKKGDRTGTGTLSVFGRQIRHNMKEGYPLLTTKKMSWKTMTKELLWFIKGDTNIRPLVIDGCNIWNGDAYKYYQTNEKNPLSIKEFIQKIKDDKTFADRWGDLGPIYGKQWRKWKIADGAYTRYVDQFEEVIDLLINNPDSRRMLVSAWNVGELEQMKLPPCHFSWQLWTRELTYKERYDYWFHNNYETGMERNYKNIPDFDNSYYDPIPKRGVSLMWNQRSVDTFLGLPFNIASYGLLLQLIAQHVNMVPLELIGSLGDTHLYLNHIEQAREQIGKHYSIEDRLDVYGKDDARKAHEAGDYTYRDVLLWDIPLHSRKPYPLPIMKINEFEDFKDLTIDDFELIDYKSHPTIKAPLSN